MALRLGLLVLVLQLSPLFSNSSFAGEQPIEIGPKGWEFTGEVKAEDPKLRIDLMGKTFLMPAKQFNIKLERNRRYRFTFDTDDPKFDPFLAIKSTTGEVLAFDDDGGGKLNSKLTFIPFSDTGLYQVFAASLHGQSGPVTLTVSSIAAFQVDPNIHAVKKGALKLAGDLTDDRQEVHFKVRLKASKNYRIDMSSGKFDSFLELRDEDGKLLAEDDDTGGKLNARISKRISKDGVYRVIASSTNFAQTGPFTLEIRAE